jgi:streptogramin lyase
VTAGRDAVWATFGDTGHATRNLTRIDPRTARTSGARLDAGRDPAALALGAGSLWIVNRAPGTVTRIDPATGRARSAIPVGRRPDALAVGSRAVWVLNSGDDTLTRVDPATDQPVDVPLSLGKQLEDIALAGGVLWVAAADRTVSRLDAVTGAVRAPPVAVGGPPLLCSSLGAKRIGAPATRLVIGSIRSTSPSSVATQTAPLPIAVDPGVPSSGIVATSRAAGASARAGAATERCSSPPRLARTAIAAAAIAKTAAATAIGARRER